jgi:hypothetical protein
VRLKLGKQYTNCIGEVSDPLESGVPLEWPFFDPKSHRTFTADGFNLHSTQPCTNDLIARYRDPATPRPAHKLNLRDGDVVKLIAWQDAHLGNLIGKSYRYQVASGKLVNVSDVTDYWADVASGKSFPKGERPLFTVISRAAEQKPVTAREVFAKDQNRRNVEMSKLVDMAQTPQSPMTSTMEYGRDSFLPHMRTKKPEPVAAPDEVIEITGWCNKQGWLLGENFCDERDTHRYTITFPAGGDTGTVVREKL